MCENRWLSKWVHWIGHVEISQAPSNVHVKSDAVCAFRTAGWGGVVWPVDGRPSAGIAWVLCTQRARSMRTVARLHVCWVMECAPHCSTCAAPHAGAFRIRISEEQHSDNAAVVHSPPVEMRWHA